MRPVVSRRFSFLSPRRAHGPGRCRATRRNGAQRAGHEGHLEETESGRRAQREESAPSAPRGVGMASSRVKSSALAAAACHAPRLQAAAARLACMFALKICNVA